MCFRVSKRTSEIECSARAPTTRARPDQAECAGALIMIELVLHQPRQMPATL